MSRKARECSAACLLLGRLGHAPRFCFAALLLLWKLCNIRFGFSPPLGNNPPCWAGQASNDLVEIEKRNMGEPNRIENCMELVEANLEVNLGGTMNENETDWF